MTPRPASFNPDTLRERAARTAQALREIDAHLARLQRAKADRERALAKFRAELALVGPQASEADDD